MTELEAYPCGRSYKERAVATYSRGDAVTVGPAYAGRDYASDRFVGAYYVLGASGNHLAGVYNDYALSRHPVQPGDDDWEVIVHASRLTPVEVPTRADKKKFATTHI